MPKLAEDKAQQVNETEGSSFEAYPEGIYQGTLQDVEVREGQKADYWSWRFSDIISVEDDKKFPGSLWVNTSLTDAADWKMKEVFAAFGVPADTDTDELLGKEVWLAVSQRVIEKGARMGETGNNVERVMPVGGEE
jgi:hypothetical protein